MYRPGELQPATLLGPLGPGTRTSPGRRVEINPDLEGLVYYFLRAMAQATLPEMLTIQDADSILGTLHVIPAIHNGIHLVVTNK